LARELCLLYDRGLGLVQVHFSGIMVYRTQHQCGGKPNDIDLPRAPTLSHLRPMDAARAHVILPPRIPGTNIAAGPPTIESASPQFASAAQEKPAFQPTDTAAGFDIGRARL
jgi:hypothetical protein